MTPDQIPDELVDRAHQAWRNAPASHLTDRMRHALAAMLGDLYLLEDGCLWVACGRCDPDGHDPIAPIDTGDSIAAILTTATDHRCPEGTR